MNEFTVCCHSEYPKIALTTTQLEDFKFDFLKDHTFVTFLNINDLFCKITSDIFIFYLIFKFLYL